MVTKNSPTVLSSQKEYELLISEYQNRIKTAETKHSGKMQAIRDSREYLKQVLPDFSQETLMSTGKQATNNNVESQRSVYCPPLSIVIGNKIASELTSMPMRFEYEANEETGVPIAQAFMKIIQRTFSQTGNMSEHLLGIDHCIYSGTYIAQPIIQDMDYGIFDKGEIPATIKAGKAIGYLSYDPLGTILDPNAVPGKVVETSEWLAVTIGRKSAAWLNAEYGLDIKTEDFEYSSGYNTAKGTILTIDTYKVQLQEESGLVNQAGFMLREYYTKDGMVYHIIDDAYVAKKHINLAGVRGIPFCVCPCILDLDSPYGIPLPEQLRPSVELVASAINMVADNVALKNKLPYLYPDGLFDPATLDALASGSANKMHNYIPVNVGILAASGGYLNVSGIKELVQKPELQEVTQGAQFLLMEGMNSVWYITGLNPSSVSGIQDKQIRVESVADMINSASLRNSSRIVINLETYLLNRLTRFFQIMYYNYYDSFNEFAKKGIPKDAIKNIKSVRVVNGSYLPADQKTREQKADFLYTMAAQNQLFDPAAVTEYVFEALGMEMSRFTRNPIEMMTEAEVMGLLDKFMAQRAAGQQTGGQQPGRQQQQGGPQ